MYILDSPAATEGIVWLAVAQSQGKRSGRAPFRTSPGSELWSRVMSGDVRFGHVRFPDTPQNYRHLISKSLQLPTWGSRAWGKAWHLSTVARNHGLLLYSSPLLFPLPSSKARTVINDNLQIHASTCPFWYQIVAMFCQPPNSSLFHGQGKRQSHVVKVLNMNWISNWALGSHADLQHNCDKFTYLLTINFSSTGDIRKKYITVYFRLHMFRSYKI